MVAVREHLFRSTWYLPAAPEAVWDALADPAGWSSWWPGLESRTVRAGDGDGVGTRSHAVFPSPLGYRLNLGLEVLAARAPHAVEMRAVGDLVGTARSTLEPDGARGSVLRIDWQVRISSAALVRLDSVRLGSPRRATPSSCARESAACAAASRAAWGSDQLDGSRTAAIASSSRSCCGIAPSWRHPLLDGDVQARERGADDGAHPVGRAGASRDGVSGSRSATIGARRSAQRACFSACPARSASCANSVPSSSSRRWGEPSISSSTSKA